MNSEQVGQRRPGGRAERVRKAVLAATTEVAAEVGFEALTIDEVSRRAGVHKTTVYRRWPTKSELLVDAALERSGERVPVPDTGSLASDLQAFARSVAANLAPGPAATAAKASIIAAAQSPELDRAMAGFWSERFSLARLMFERAEARGELPPASPEDHDFLIESLIGPLWVRMLLTGGPTDDRTADRSAALVATGLGLDS